MNKKVKLLQEKIHPSLVEYWAAHETTLSNMYCRECGELMLDLENLEHVEIIYDTREGKDGRACFVQRYSPKTTASIFSGTMSFIPNETNRWLVNGKNLSGKVFHRRICWKCFFKKLRATVDIPKKARKSSWYQKILAGEDPIPVQSTSPSPIFKLLFDITDEELDKERKKFDTASLESFIRRHGKKQGQEKFKTYSKRQSYTCSKEYMMGEKGMTEDQWNEFNQHRATTEKNLIRRYGKELGKKKWKEYCEREAYAGNKLEYFIEKLGQEEGTRKYLEVCSQKATTLTNFMRKYGEKEGKIKYSEMLKNTPYQPYSNISQVLFEQIDSALGKLAANSFWAKKNYEQEVNYLDESTGVTRTYRVDYMLRDKIIEFNGTYWHASPQFYAPDEVILVHGEPKAASEIWEGDKARLETIKSHGYKVLVIWEEDYHTDPMKIVQQCCEFLKG